MGLPVMFAAMPLDEHMSRLRRFVHALHMPTPLLPWLGTCVPGVGSGPCTIWHSTAHGLLQSRFPHAQHCSA